MIHKPVFRKTNVDNREVVVYDKDEWDDDFLFNATKSISINAEALEHCDFVQLTIHHIPVVLLASKVEIKHHKDVKKWGEETKYYFPIELWRVLQGDKDWFYKYGVERQKKLGGYL